MNVTLARALFLDALYQVLDNRVFRILVIVTAVLVLFPVLVSFKSEEVVILFGWRRFGYEEMFSIVGGMFGVRSVDALRPDELQELAVTAYQEQIVGGLMGTLGMFVCIAATAFFVPQMIEKGAADTLFSKPVSRLALLVGRYLTGVLFVGLLASLLVGGTYLTLLLSSGYGDTDFLWTAPTLTYKFALVFGVTILIAIFTRSTVASILLTLVFLMFNGCVHTGWNAVQMSRSVDPAERHRSSIRVEVDGEHVDLDEKALSEEDEEEPDTFFAILGKVFNGLHYTLPKTGDADTIASKLRTSLASEDGAAYTDPDVEFVLQSPPPDFEALEPAALTDEALFHPEVEGDRVVYAAGFEGSDRDARLVVHKRPERQIPIGSTGRMRSETTKRAADFLEEWVTSDDARVLVDDMRSFTIADETTWAQYARELRWTTRRGGEEWNVQTLVVNEDEWIIAISLETRGEWLDERPNVRQQFGGRDYKFGSGSLDALQAAQDPNAWFAERLSWGGEWRYSIWFSVGSSLAFLAVCLALAWLRLSRIDF